MLSIVLSLTDRKVAYIKTELVTRNSYARRNICLFNSNSIIMFLVNYLFHHDMFYFTEQELIGDLLTFIMGADEEPPLGFDSPLRATFGHPQDAKNDPRMPFPFANSCFNSIRIPVLETYRYSIFRTHMINTILTVKEFGDY